MTFETIRYETEGPIAWITLNRPEKLNAIDTVMTGELMAATDRAQLDDEVRVVVVKGEGRAFSAGLDLGMDDPPPIEPGLSFASFIYYAASAAGYAARATSAEEVREAIRGELVPWALREHP